MVWSAQPVSSAHRDRRVGARGGSPFSATHVSPLSSSCVSLSNIGLHAPSPCPGPSVAAGREVVWMKAAGTVGPNIRPTGARYWKFAD